jgi:hypothetical protein
MSKSKVESDRERYHSQSLVSTWKNTHVHTCIHACTYSHVYIQTCAHSCTHIHRPTLTHVHSDTLIHTCTHSHVHTIPHSCTWIHACTYSHVHTHAHTHSCIHMHTFTHACIGTHTHAIIRGKGQPFTSLKCNWQRLHHVQCKNSFVMKLRLSPWQENTRSTCVPGHILWLWNIFYIIREHASPILIQEWALEVKLLSNNL